MPNLARRIKGPIKYMHVLYEEDAFKQKSAQMFREQKSAEMFHLFCQNSI